MFDCEATVSGDAAELAAQQCGCWRATSPEGGFRPVTPDDPLYHGAIHHTRPCAGRAVAPGEVQAGAETDPWTRARKS